MPRELINANITHVSYVDKGANQKQFFFTKSVEQPDFEKEVKVFVNKEDKEQQLVYGIVYEPEVPDAHNDFMTATEIEKAAHGFMKDARNIDRQHDFESGVGEVVESYIAPADFTIGDQVIAKGSWILVTKASDEIWADIKKGEITGYSMAGTAETIEKAASTKPEPEPLAKEDDEFKGFFNLLKGFFTKGEVRDRYEDNQKRRNLWAVWDGMESTYYDSLWENRTPDVADFERLESGVQDFLSILQEIRTSGDIEKALGDKPETIRKGDTHMKKEDIEKLLDEKFGDIEKRLSQIEKDENGEGEPAGDDEVAKQFAEALEAKLDPIAKRLETLEKSRGVSNQLDVEKTAEQEIKKDEGPAYLRHFA